MKQNEYKAPFGIEFLVDTKLEVIDTRGVTGGAIKNCTPLLTSCGSGNNTWQSGDGSTDNFVITC
jgi:hypothetical protein